MKTDAFFLATGAFHILANLIVFALPLRTTIKNLSGGGLREKFGVGLVLGTGLGIVVCSFLRLQRLKGPDNKVDPTCTPSIHIAFLLHFIFFIFILFFTKLYLYSQILGYKD